MRIHIVIAWLFVLALLAAGATACSPHGDADSSENESDSAEVSDTTADKSGEDEDDKDRAQTTKDDDEDDDDDLVPVDITVLARGPIESVIRASASLEAESQVEVAAEAARRVRTILVEEGETVRVGQLLLRLQDEEQKSAVAKLESRLAKASRDLDRQKELRARDLTSDKDLSDTQYAYDQEKIALDDAKRELSYTQVRAQIPGVIAERAVNVGDQVQVGQPLFHIIDFESMVARIYVPEKNLKQVSAGQKARVVARAVTDEPYTAHVLRISPIVDPKTGTVKVTLAVGGQPGLRPGLFVDVELVTAVHENALLVPKRALVYDNDQVFVFFLGEGRKVERRLVTPALSDKFNVEPTEGLAEGDTVIIAGQTGLRNGARVSLVGETAESDEDGEESVSADESGSESDSQ